MLSILYTFYTLSTAFSFINANTTNNTVKRLNTISGLFRLSSTKILENKLYALYKANEDKSVQLRVYELKEDLIANIFNNGKTFNLTDIDNGFDLVFFDNLNELEKDSNKLWVKSKQYSYGHEYNQLDGNWIGYINLNDMTLTQDLEILKFPRFDNFPAMGFAMSAITNQYGTSLYVTGGELYSKREHTYLITDSFFKYNFTSKEWIDMKNIVKGKFNPLSNHKSFAIDNRYLIIVGGIIPRSLEELEDSGPNLKNLYEFNSVRDLQVFDTFTNKWENIKLNSTVADTSANKIEFHSYLAKVYKGQILALGGWKSEDGSDSKSINNHVGILDVKSKSWTWTPIVGEDGFDSELQSVHKDFQIFNDQIIMFSDYDKKTRTASILVYDLSNQRIKSTLRPPDVSKIDDLTTDDLTTETNKIQHQSRGLPAYAIVLISLGSIVLALILAYLLYRKYKNTIATKNNTPIREVWSNTNIDISQKKSILWDKRKGIYLNPNMANNTDYRINTSFNSQSIEFNK